jgi:hypothetical protein
MEKCQYCGKNRYDYDKTEWIYNNYIINGYSKKFFFCCRGHAARFNDETDYKLDDGKDICFYCRDKYYRDKGVSQYLSKNGTSEEYKYCSSSCATNHENSDNFIWVDVYGNTYSQFKALEAKIAIKQAERRKEEQEEKSSLWFKQILGYFLSGIVFLLGVILICYAINNLFYQLLAIVVFWWLYYNYFRPVFKKVFAGLLQIKYYNSNFLDTGVEGGDFEIDVLGLFAGFFVYCYYRFFEQIPILYLSFKIWEQFQ